MLQSIGYAAASQGARLAPFKFQRRDPGPNDIVIEILYCGICHSDMHFVDNDWHIGVYPMVPGHEIVGRVTTVGSAVKKFKVGDTAAIGCIVDSCMACAPCKGGLEQRCEQGPVGTYSSYERGTTNVTYGGYSNNYVVDEHFALRVPPNLDPAAAAPLLCAGITTYSPLRRWQVRPGQRVGVVGVGGLGHMAIKLARVMGAEVVVFSTSPSKVKDAKRLGAHEVVLSTDPEQMKLWSGQLDLILDTVSANHDVNAYLQVLKNDAVMCLLGYPGTPLAVAPPMLLFWSKILTGSGMGGIPETQEMLDFCGQHGITADIEMIRIQRINEAYERLKRNDVQYRFVIDLASLKD